jgi:hypothetical protein
MLTSHPRTAEIETRAQLRDRRHGRERCQQRSDAPSGILLRDRPVSVLGSLVESVMNCAVRVNVDEAWRDIAPAHVEHHSLPSNLLPTHHAGNLATLNQQGVPGKDTIGQHNLTVDKRGQARTARVTWHHDIALHRWTNP